MSTALIDALGSARVFDLEQPRFDLLEPLAYADKFHRGEEAGQAFFKLLREYTVMGFYTSEIGYKDLDNPALKFYATSPECPHKDDPQHLHLATAKG